MNAAPFPGSGMKESAAMQTELMTTYFGEAGTATIKAADNEQEAFADAVSEALEQPLPPIVVTDRAIFERSIAARRLEKAKHQAIAAAAMAKVRQLTASIRSMEDALDGLLVSEVA